jgi:hypothetical protein
MASAALHLYMSHVTWAAGRGGSAGALAGGVLEGHGPEAWQSLGEALRQHFPTETRVRGVLSGRWCRFVSVPWTSSCRTGGAIRAYVGEMFAAMHAISAATHHIQIEWPPYGQPILAVAYPRAMVEAVGEGLAACGFVLEGIASSIDPVLRRFAPGLGNASALLAYAEDDGVTGITLESGQVAQVETLLAGDGGLDDVSLWMTRKRFAFADDGALHWIATAPRPTGVAAVELALTDADSAATPGHALVAICSA